MPYKDPEARRASARKSYARHHDLRRAKARAAYHADPSKQRAASHKWMSNNLAAVRLQQARVRAKRRGLEFNLTLEDVSIPDTCPILGIKLVPQFGRGAGFLANAPTLDRIDNSKGYVKGNVWTISGQANVMKNSADRDQLLAFARWVLDKYT